jgi:trimethylamine--corrinoid protein Co-methyltransferase
MEVLSADQIEAIHRTSLDILENSRDGGDVADARWPCSRRRGRSRSASEFVSALDRGLVDQPLSSAPASFVLTPRNAASA